MKIDDQEDLRRILGTGEVFKNTNTMEKILGKGTVNYGFANSRKPKKSVEDIIDEENIRNDGDFTAHECEICKKEIDRTPVPGTKLINLLDHLVYVIY